MSIFETVFLQAILHKKLKVLRVINFYENINLRSSDLPNMFRQTPNT